MRSTSLAAVTLLTLAVVGCNRGGAGAGGDAGVPESLEQRASYALGYSAGQQLSSQAGDLDIDQLVAGLRDAFAGEDGRMSVEEIDATMREYQQAMMAAENERMTVEAEANKAEGDAYLAENAQKAGVMVTDSGLQYEVLEEGTGASPMATDQVTVHYEGRLIDGTVFDSSYQKGTPATFPLNQVIRGWTEGLQLMKVGSKYRFAIPGELGYGMQPRGATIGPNDTLIFEVELLAINGQS